MCKFMTFCTIYHGIDIQTSTQHWNHLVFCAGLLIPEVIISSKLSHRQPPQLLLPLSSTLKIGILYDRGLVFFNVVPSLLTSVFFWRGKIAQESMSSREMIPIPGTFLGSITFDWLILTRA